MTALNAENLFMIATHAKHHAEHLRGEIDSLKRDLIHLEDRILLAEDMLRSAARIETEAHELREAILNPDKATADLRAK